MASITLRDGRFPVGSNVSLFLPGQKGVPSSPQPATPGGSAPNGAAVAGPVAVAADGSVTFAGLPDGTVYTAYALVGSLHTYADVRTENARLTEPGRESKLQEPIEDEKSRLWLPGAAVAENMRRADATGNVAAPTSGTLVLAGGAVLPKGKTVSRIGFVSGTTALATGTHQVFALYRALDRALLGVTADDTNVAWGANAVKELLLASPFTPTDDVGIYFGLLVTASTMPSLAGAVMQNAALASIGGANHIAGTADTGLAGTPASLPAVAAALTGQTGIPYAWAR